MKTYSFVAEIIPVEKVDGAYVKFPFDVKEEFETGGMVKVKATFDGYPYRGVLAKMGTTCHMIGITKAIRKAIGKQPGDSIEVTIVRDVESRAEELPEYFVQGLEEAPEARTFFNSLTDSQKNKFIKHVSTAKKEATREKRMSKVMEMLHNKEKMK